MCVCVCERERERERIMMRLVMRFITVGSGNSHGICRGLIIIVMNLITCTVVWFHVIHVLQLHVIIFITIS